MGTGATHELSCRQSNPDYEPIVLSAEDSEHVEVIGEMVAVLSGEL